MVSDLQYVNLGSAFYGTISGSTGSTVNTAGNRITNTLDHVSVTGAFVGGGSLQVKDSNNNPVASVGIGIISNTLTDTTVGGNAHCAFSQAATVNATVTNNFTRVTCVNFYGTGSNAGSTATAFTGTVTNNIDTLTITTGNYFGAGYNLITGSVTNSITGTIHFETAGTDDKTLYLGAFSGQIDAGAGNPAVTNTLTNATVDQYIVCATNTGVITGNVTTTFDNVTSTKWYKKATTTKVDYAIYGGSNNNTGVINGNVTVNFGGEHGPLTVGGAVYGGGEGTINGKLTTNVYKFGANLNGQEYAFYAGQNTGVINVDPGETALEFNVIPASNSDVWFNTGVYGGSNAAAINGDIEITLAGGTQWFGRQFGLGQYATINANGTTHYVVDGDITANIYGGNWGALYLGARNYNRSDTAVGVTGDITLNLYGGNVGAINKGFDSTHGLYAGGDTIVNIYTTAAPAPYTAQNLVLRSIVDGAARTNSTEGGPANTPYEVNVIAGDRTLYVAQNSLSATTAQEASVFDSVTGTLKVAPAPAGVAYYEVPAWVYGDEDYYVGTSCMYSGAYDYASTFSITVKNTTSEATIADQEGPYSVLTFATDGTDSTWTGNNLRLSHIAGEQVVMGAQFTVRVLLNRTLVERITVTNSGVLGVTYTLNSGEPVAVATLTSGTGDLADYYYFDVTGISAKDYKDATIEVNMTRPGLAAVTSDTLTGSQILADLETVGADETEVAKNVKLAQAIGEFADAMNAYDAGTAYAEGTVADITDEQVDEMLADNNPGVAATTEPTVVADHIKAVGVNLTVGDTVTINFWFHITPGYDAEITSAAINGVALDLSAEGVLTQRYNGEEATNYWTVSYECDADDLSTMLTITINGGLTEFNACPLSYAKALRAQAPELAQAVINYAYYVNAYAERA